MVLVLRSIYHFVLVMQIDCVSECVLFIFFFKQKTAYDMRISDWSSDVCSSDLRGVGGIFYDHLEGAFDANFAFTKDVGEAFLAIFPTIVRRRMGLAWTSEERQRQLERSEEHTSELQSLMRISYAVFCLKQKIYRHILLQYTYRNADITIC